MYLDESPPIDMPVTVTLAVNGATLAGGATATNGTGGAQLTLSGAGAANGLLVATIDTTSAAGGGVAQPRSCAVQLAAGAATPTMFACAGATAAAHFASLILFGH